MLPPTDIRRVVVVVLDGLRPDAIDAFDLTHLRRLAHVGPSTMSARTVSPSLTWPALTSLLTGVGPDVHGIVADCVQLPQPRGPLLPLPELLLRRGFPSFAFMGQLPSVYGMFAARIAERLGFTGARFAGADAVDILIAARPTLSRQQHGFVFFHWADADRAGHEHGWMSPKYGDAAKGLDSALGLLASSMEIERDPHTLLIALADHGGGGIDANDHDGEHPLNVTIPLILSGAGLAHHGLGEASLLDVPPTVARVLGLEAPASYEGRALCEAFSTQGDSAVA